MKCGLAKMLMVISTLLGVESVHASPGVGFQSPEAQVLLHEVLNNTEMSEDVLVGRVKGLPTAAKLEVLASLKKRMIEAKYQFDLARATRNCSESSEDLLTSANILLAVSGSAATLSYAIAEYFAASEAWVQRGGAKRLAKANGEIKVEWRRNTIAFALIFAGAIALHRYSKSVYDLSQENVAMLDKNFGASLRWVELTISTLERQLQIETQNSVSP